MPARCSIVPNPPLTDPTPYRDRSRRAAAATVSVALTRVAAGGRVPCGGCFGGWACRGRTSEPCARSVPAGAARLSVWAALTLARPPLFTTGSTDRYGQRQHLPTHAPTYASAHPRPHPHAENQRSDDGGAAEIGRMLATPLLSPLGCLRYAPTKSWMFMILYFGFCARVRVPCLVHCLSTTLLIIFMCQGTCGYRTEKSRSPQETL